ncbi:hypothetical protein LMG26858_06222 [Achromobacter anxifer]|uniref:Uncharacterized protein n=1 Tax=Achromobacter anxifer TaxID=1287737 RepID=A0A6S7F2K6_9BURK|nr:hypothetical protein [Achromobacter anxifer]CAB3928414.1 hypothetical protein LMG26858_06222 [Achromobacter anxifer]CAB5511355.1 hypothetical protein LMG26857_00642 [Achromobacter anxifer]
MNEVYPANFLQSGELLAWGIFQKVPLLWGAGLLLCVESNLPGLSPRAWRAVRDAMIALMAVFLLACIAYAIFGYAVAVQFDKPAYFDKALEALRLLSLSICMAVFGLAVRARIGRGAVSRSG